jgi:hypothetical protein
MLVMGILVGKEKRLAVAFSDASTAQMQTGCKSG